MHLDLVVTSNYNDDDHNFEGQHIPCICWPSSPNGSLPSCTLIHLSFVLCIYVTILILIQLSSFFTAQKSLAYSISLFTSTTHQCLLDLGDNLISVIQDSSSCNFCHPHPLLTATLRLTFPEQIKKTQSSTHSMNSLLKLICSYLPLPSYLYILHIFIHYYATYL